MLLHKGLAWIFSHAAGPQDLGVIQAAAGRRLFILEKLDPNLKAKIRKSLYLRSSYYYGYFS